MIDSPNRVLVTGGEGQLAQSYLKVYNANLYKSHCLSKDILDITNVKHFKSYIKKYGKPDVIINCAAMTDVDKAEKNSNLANEINAFAIERILSHFNGLFIQISTDYVFDGKRGGYLSTDIPKPINAYGISKSMGEKIVQNNSKSWVIIRAGSLFSAVTDNNFYSWVISSLKKNEIINVVQDQICNPVSTLDVAQYIVDIQKDSSMRNTIYHIGSNVQISKYDFAVKIAKACGLNHYNINPISTTELTKINSNYIAKRPKNSSLNVLGEGDRECNLSASIDFLTRL